MSEDIIIRFESSGRYNHPDRKWRMGLSQDDHKWLTETLGVRAKREETWNKGLGQWRYLGSQNKTHHRDEAPTYIIRVQFRTKAQAMLFKLARLGQI